MTKNVQNLCFIIAALVLIISCSSQKIIPDLRSTTTNAFIGEYNVTEKYDVLAGALTGRKGEPKYPITLSRSIKGDSLFIENFANSFKVTVSVNGTALLISPQKFPHQGSLVMIKGSGIILSDTIRYEYFSGGPAGQIECKCIAVKKK